MAVPARPTISCLTVTQPGRIELLVDAVRCFAAQSHAARELVVVHDGSLAFHADVRAVLAQQGGSAPAVVRRVPAQSLGSLRNHTVAVASGELVCQWDDDDLFHPERLAAQLLRLDESGAVACLFTEQLHLFETTAELCYDDWTVEHFPMCFIQGTLLARRADLPPYPDLKRGEDSVAVHRLVARRSKLAGLQDAGELYVYRFTGANAWDHDHHRAISAWKHLADDVLLARLAVIGTALRRYPVEARPVLLRCSSGPVALTLGS